MGTREEHHSEALLGSLPSCREAYCIAIDFLHSEKRARMHPSNRWSDKSIICSRHSDMKALYFEKGKKTTAGVMTSI